jgi:RNA polymerase sigma-70 factor, ECF subfamily
VPCACFQAFPTGKPAQDVHKGRTTKAPWDPVLVQKAFATSPASQACSALHCSRNDELTGAAAIDKNAFVECLYFEEAHRDAKLAERLLTADDVRELYDRHGPALVLYARFYVNDFGAAEDAVHGVFLKLLSRAETMPPKPAAYLYRAVKNAALNLLRDRARESPIPEHDLWFTRGDHNREAILALLSDLNALTAAVSSGRVAASEKTVVAKDVQALPADAFDWSEALGLEDWRSRLGQTKYAIRKILDSTIRI